jgi:hypothetical protein
LFLPGVGLITSGSPTGWSVMIRPRHRVGASASSIGKVAWSTISVGPSVRSTVESSRYSREIFERQRRVEPHVRTGKIAELCARERADGREPPSNGASQNASMA